MSQETLKESFEWVNPKDLPKDRLLKVIMKTPETTIHPEDPEYPKRVFKVEELIQNGKSLIGSRVGYNHQGLIMSSMVVDSEWNKLEEQLEGILYVPKGIIQKVREGKINQASIEYHWRDEKKTEEGTEFEGLHIFRIDLLEGKKAGDHKTSVTLFESKERRGRFLMEMTEQTDNDTEPEKKPSDFEDEESCKAAGFNFYDNACHKEPKPEPTGEETEDPIDPPAEVAVVKPAPETLTTQEDCEKADYFWDGAVCKAEKPAEPTTAELTEALQRVLGENKKLKESKEADITKATEEAKEEILTLVESKIPNSFIGSRFNLGARRFIFELRKTIREIRES